MKLFNQLLKKAAPPVKTPQDIFMNKLNVAKDYTLCRESKLVSLMELAMNIEHRGIKGDFVECGAYKGGSAALIVSTLSPDRRAWLYDSFEGMPVTGDKDGEEAAQWVGACVGSVPDVQAVFNKMQIAEERLTIKKGWFSETFKQETPETIAFLHVDADWYDSVLLVLETFYDKVNEGGVIVLDDFGHWEGCREAFYDFCHRKGIRPLLERFENDQAFWIKGRLHNRDGWVHQPQVMPATVTE